MSVMPYAEPRCAKVVEPSVELALAKFANGQYGVSEKTGDPIPYERLVAVPWAREPVGE